MGYLKYMRDLWKQPKKNNILNYKNKLVLWRKEKSITRLKHPTRIDRARSLGFRAKQGFVMARVRVLRGGKRNPSIRKGRDGGNLSTKIVHSKNYQWICEERCQRRFLNLEVLNSYWVGEDEKHVFYEVILVDKNHPQIRKDKILKHHFVNQHKKRVFRGLTSSGKKSRGLRNKGMGSEKTRPSLRSHKRRLR